MNIVKKWQPLSVPKQKSSMHRQTPGPGAYDIALPLIKPNYQAIRKSNDVIILKVNHKGESCNFRSEQDRFPEEKEKSPGPAQYTDRSNDAHKKISHPKYSQRYADLIDFMYKLKPKIPVIPDYQVHYDEEQQISMRKIKNSQRRSKQSYLQAKVQMTNKKQLSSSTHNMKSISVASRATSQIGISQNAKQKPTTIDFPQQNQRVKQNKSSHEKQSHMLLHRITLYNRSMLGVLMAKSKQKKKTIDHSSSKLSCQNISHSNQENKKQEDQI